jgi:hypothetical protein
MKPIVYALSGITGGAALNTIAMLVLGHKELVPAWTITTVALFIVTVGVSYVDYRIRLMLLALCRELLAAAAEKNRPLIYNSVRNLYNEITHGKSLTHSSAELGRLSTQLELHPDLETTV